MSLCRVYVYYIDLYQCLNAILDTQKIDIHDTFGSVWVHYLYNNGDSKWAERIIDSTCYFQMAANKKLKQPRTILFHSSILSFFPYILAIPSR